MYFRKKKGVKYNNIKCKINGIEFDSKAEGQYYLQLLEKASKGLISNIKTHPKFLLQNGFSTSQEFVEKKGLQNILITNQTKKLNWIKCIQYESDFQYTDSVNGLIYVVDVKGEETADFKLKKKMLLKLFSEKEEYKNYRFLTVKM